MLIFIFGDDALRVKERVADMKKKFVEKFDAAGMNVDDFATRDGAAFDKGAVVGAVQASPFLAEKRMVIVRGLVSGTTKAESKAWIEGLSHTPVTTILILADVATVAAVQKSALYTALKDTPDAHAYPLPELLDAELRTFAQERAITHGATVSANVMTSLLARTLGDSWRVDAELRKLAAYANGSPVTEEMVKLLVRSDVEADIFGFIDAMAGPSSKTALKKLQDERAAGADDFQIFGMLLRQVRLFLQVRDLLDADPRVSKDTVAKKIAVHPFVAQKTMTQVKSWSKERLEALHQMAFKLDKAMKTGTPPDIAVDKMVARFLI